jgi:endonuclease YncB( thermonuclease family)
MPHRYRRRSTFSRWIRRQSSWRLIFFGLVTAVALYAGWDRHRYWWPVSSPAPTSSQAALTGQVRVVDGDTIVMGARRIRLWGIDAPESTQMCSRSGEVYDCGEAATMALRAKLGDSAVSCVQRDTDKYGRVVAICSLDDQDVGRWLVENGLAVAYRHFSANYYDAPEKFARSKGLGLWAGTFDWPWDWRRAHPRQ